MRNQSYLAMGLSLVGLSLVVASITATTQMHVMAQERPDGPDQRGHDSDERTPIEPNAGNWRTWVISSGKDYRVPPPPGQRETKDELRALKTLIRHNDAQAQQQIEFWDAGAPAYRWIDLLNSRALAGTSLTAYSQRVYK